MKSLLAGALVSAVVAAAAPAYANTIAEGSIQSPYDQFNLVRGSKLPSAGTMFTDYYTFSVSGPTFLDTSFTLSGMGPQGNQTPTGVTLTLYSGTVSGSHTPLGSISTEGAHLTYDLTSPPGMYYIQVSGTSQGSAGGYGGTASFQSTVPLPNSVALFGVAVAGLGIAGAARRRSKAPAV